MSAYDCSGRKERVRALASRQAGRVGRAQLSHLGVEASLLQSWLRTAYLERRLPRVYAVGHAAPGVEASLFEAVLYAGPGAMLSHGTAAWWLELIEHPVAALHVSTPREVRSLGQIVVHARRDCRAHRHRGITVTGIAQTLLDLAATEELLLVRKALARLDFRRRLEPAPIRAVCGRGRPGAAALTRALDAHDPRFAQTNGRLEDDFLGFCERHGVPLPQLGVRLRGIQVDAYWPRAGLVAELDGFGNHGTPAQLRRDRRNELVLRRDGLTVVRYDWAQVHFEPLLVRDDLLARLADP